MAIVLFWGFLVFRKKLFVFSGGATGDNGGIACPFLGHPCFQLKWFALLGGCNILISGHRMSLF